MNPSVRLVRKPANGKKHAMRDISPALITPAAYGPNFALGGVYDSAGRLQRDCLRPTIGASDSIDPEALPLDFAPERTVADAVYAGRFFQHFGHHLVETLPSLHAAAPYGGAILMHPWPAPLPDSFANDGFRGVLIHVLGIDPARITFVNAAMRVERLTVAKLPPPPMSGKIGEDFIAPFRIIRSAALAQHAGDPAKIYLSRRDFSGGTNRRLINEAAVEDALSAHGFTILKPEKLPIMEQIAIVARASVVAGMDGSAMHLCHFMAPDSRVVCIHTRPFHVLRYINAALGIGLRSVPAESIGAANDETLFTTDIVAVLEAALAP